MALPAFRQAAESRQQQDTKVGEEEDKKDILFGKIALWK